jgi:hypothetical protein
LPWFPEDSKYVSEKRIGDDKNGVNLHCVNTEGRPGRCDSSPLATVTACTMGEEAFLTIINTMIAD